MDQNRATDVPSAPPRRSPAALIAALGVLGLVVGVSALVVTRSGGVPKPAGAASISEADVPRAIAAALDAARVLMKEGKWTQAEAILSSAADQFVDDQELRVAWAESLLAQRRYEEAYRQYEAALAIGPRKPALEFAAGQTASVAGLIDRAIEHFSMAQTLDPRRPAAPLMLGLVQRRAGQLDAAKASLLRAANMDPANAFAWGTLADIALGENNLGLALQHVQRARELQPDSREWRLIEARLRARRGEPEAALMLLMPLDPSQRRDAPVVRLMAQCLGMLNRHADAAGLWVDAARANPASAELAYEAAVALERAGDSASASGFARDAQRLGHPGAGALVERLR